MGRPRGSKRRGAQETHKAGIDQDPEFSPPSGSRYPKTITRGVALQLLCPSSGNPQDQSGSRYPKRSSRGVVPHLLSPSSVSYAEIDNDNPSHSRSLEGPLRFLKEARVIPKPELHNLSSQPPDDPVCGISEDNVKLSPPTGSCSSAPFSQPQLDLENFCAKLVSQVEGTDQVTPQALDLNGHSQQQINPGGFEGTVEVDPQLRDVNGDSQLPRENNVVSRVEVMQEKSITNDVPLSGHCFSPAHSLNLTAFARALHDDSDVDPDEVESAPGSSYGIVQGHRVKIEFAPLLTKIFQKYGDITIETNAPSFVLERLCTVYQRLEHRDFFDLTRLEINEMLRDLDFIESQKINVGWLLAKVKEISEAKSSLSTYTMLKDEACKCIKFKEDMGKELERQRMHIALIQKKVSEGEELMIASVAKSNEYTEKLLDIKTRVKALATKPLVHGLL